MIRAILFEDVSDLELKRRLNSYINTNVQKAFLVARDSISVFELSINDILDDHNFDLNEKQLTEYFYTAFDIVFSESFRDKLKPIYKYFIFQVIDWFVEVTGEVLHSQIEPLHEGLIDRINEYYDSEEAEFIISEISDYTRYNELIFDDFDFLSPMVEDMVQIYMKNPQLFCTVFADINLDDFVPLMPKDLKELYLEFQDDLAKTQILESETLNIKKLTKDIVRICEMIQSRTYMCDWNEDQHNDTIRNGLELKGYIVRDQTRTGESATGIQSGEADVQVFYNNVPNVIIESIVLSSLEKKEITDHIHKIYNYDKRGNFANHFITFVKVKNFKSYWGKYRQFILNFDYNNGLKKIGFFEIDVNQGSELKAAVSVLERSGQQTYLFHIAVHLDNSILTK